VWVIGYKDGNEKLVNLDNLVEIVVIPDNETEDWKVIGRVIASGGFEGDFGMEVITLFKGSEEECENFLNDIKIALMPIVPTIVKTKREKEEVVKDV